MAYKLTEIPDFVSASSGLMAEADERGTSAAAQEGIACDTNFCLRYHFSALSFKLAAPGDNTANLYQFHSSIRERLTKCSEGKKYHDNELQLNLWPIITEGHSVSVIGAQSCGKTTAYVLYLLNRFRLSGYLQVGVTADQMAAKASPLFQPQRICGSKIYAIVLTDSMRSVTSIGIEFTKWLRILMPQPKAEAEVEKRKEAADEEDGNFDKAAAFRRRQAQRNQFSVRVNLLHEKSPLVDYFDVINGCAVLVSTAGALTRLIRMQLIPLNDNQVLIIDHADEFINSASSDVVDLFELTSSPRYDFYSDRQTMLFARKWTPYMSKYFFEVQHKPTLVLSSFFDATIIFKQATAKIELCLEADSAEEAVVRVVSSELLCSERVLVELQRGAIIGAIICKNYSQVESMKARLEDSKSIDTERLQLFVLKESATEAEMNRLSVDLLTAGHHIVKLVLLTTEDIFAFALYFRKFNCLLHLDQSFDQYRDLPTALNYRFLIACDLFTGANGQKDDAEEKFQIEQLGRLKVNNFSGLGKHHILNYFFLSQSEHPSVHEERFKQTVVDLLEYCGHLDNTTATFMNTNIADYIQMNIECNICPQFAAFAKCKARDKGLMCWKGRHTLTRQLGCTSSVKKVAPNWQIWFKITHVEEPNQFFIHLLGYRSEEQATGSWVTTEHRLEMARLESILTRYSDQKHKRRVISPLTIDQVYVMHYIGDLYRVQLRRIHPLTGTEDLPIWLDATRTASLTDEQLTFFRLTVTVFALDTGRTITTKAFNLIAFDPADVPTSTDIPPLAYRVYLPEVVPLEGAYSWHSMFSPKLGALSTDSFLLEMDGAKEENTITGWVLAVNLPSEKDTTTTTTIWLHQVILGKMLRFVGVYTHTNLAADMIRREVAVANDRTFPGCDYQSHTRVSAIWRANAGTKKPQKLIQKLTDIQENESSDDEDGAFYVQSDTNSDDNDSDEPKVVTGELVDTDSDEDEALLALGTNNLMNYSISDNGFIIDFDRQVLNAGFNFDEI